MFYKDSKKKELLETLPDVFHKIMLAHRLPLGDFPDIRKFKALAVNHDFAKVWEWVWQWQWKIAVLLVVI
jgi:hypothetical protein